MTQQRRQWRQWRERRHSDGVWAVDDQNGRLRLPLVVPRFPALLAASCLGTAALVMGGRWLLERRSPLTPATPTRTLQLVHRWSPDAGRRREAALLLVARTTQGGDAAERRRLLQGQGWGTDPLAALVLKLDARAAGALGLEKESGRIWGDLLRRFPRSPASADALYELGRDRPPLRAELLRRFPAHPAALAAAVEQGPAPPARLAGALHLARWGERWPGARARIQASCASEQAPPGQAQRLQLAGGLARLGDAPGAMTCLQAQGQAAAAALARLPAPDRLELARALLADPAAPRRRLGLGVLVDMVRGEPEGPSAEEAVRLLALQQGEEATAALQRLPERWRDSAPVVARALLASLPQGGKPQPLDPSRLGAGLAALRRWPEDPASRDLQWDLTRRALLAEDWGQAERLLEAIPPERQPPPLAARHRFWRGFVQQRRGRPADAAATWRTLRRHLPGGYYGWRASVRLGEDDLRWTPGAHGSGPAALAAEAWAPLASGDAGLDRLWRLDQHTEAWETWRSARGGRMPQESEDLLVEGRLRQGVGDDWTGFAQLELASLRLDPARCDLLPQLERSLHPPRFMAIFGAASRQRGLPIELPLGLAKQESRFTPNVRSAAGAVGLMQLLPSTASEVAGRPVSAEQLEDPALNAELGTGYLAALLRRWKGNPFLLAASYNAGPGAAAGWIDPRLETAPELWTEAIPYPETRLYVKKVLGNVWSYQVPETPRC